MKRQSKTQKTLSEYPVGIFLETEKGYFYVSAPGKRMKFTTKRVLDSWSPQKVVQASESWPAVQRLRVSSKMKFRNGSLLHCQADGKMYLVSEHKLRHIKNPDVLDGLNRKRTEAVWVSEDEINLHEKGEPLD